jgi:hypothetical protein
LRPLFNYQAKEEEKLKCPFCCALKTRLQLKNHVPTCNYRTIEIKLELIETFETEFEKVEKQKKILEKDKAMIEAQNAMLFKEKEKFVWLGSIAARQMVLEKQNAENEALKTELKKARSKADQTSITEACLKENEAEIVHLRATNGSLSIDLNKAKATAMETLETELEKVKCSVTKILNSDLQKKVNRMKEQKE